MTPPSALCRQQGVEPPFKSSARMTRHQWYRQLKHARSDVSGLSAGELLAVDQKSRKAGGVALGLCSVPATMAALVRACGDSGDSDSGASAGSIAGAGGSAGGGAGGGAGGVGSADEKAPPAAAGPPPLSAAPLACLERELAAFMAKQGVDVVLAVTAAAADGVGGGKRKHVLLLDRRGPGQQAGAAPRAEQLTRYLAQLPRGLPRSLAGDPLLRKQGVLSEGGLGIRSAGDGFGLVGVGVGAEAGEGVRAALDQQGQGPGVQVMSMRAAVTRKALLPLLVAFLEEEEAGRVEVAVTLPTPRPSTMP
jgi:hypothetical protein